MQTHTDSEYINTDPFFGDESELSCRTIAIKTARKDHLCYGLQGEMDHGIRTGTRYRYEKALIDGDFWGEFRICLCCMDEFMGSDGDDDDDDE